MWCPKPCKNPGYWCFVFFLPKWQILIGYISKTSGHACVTLSTRVFTSSFMNMHGPWLVHSLQDYYARGGHSHFGGATYVGLLRPPFSAPLSPNDPIFFFFLNWWLSLKDPLFSFGLSRKASNFSIFPTADWLFQMILCTILSKVRNSILGISMGLKRLSPKDPKITFLPNAPIKKCSLSPKGPLLFLFFSHQMPLGVKTGVLYLYWFHIWVPPGLCHFFVLQFQNRLYSFFKHLCAERCSGIITLFKFFF